MDTSTEKHATRVWLLLMAITLGSWGVGTDLLGVGGTMLSLTVVLVLTVTKMHLVLVHFMNVRQAPAFIGYLCSAWLLTLFVTMLWIYG